MKTPSTRENNFDLLRLVAAAQVAFFHTTKHLGVPVDHSNPLVAAAAWFSGVPIFFVVSGFLISASWEHNPEIRTYARNRALRIYPALWVCIAVSIACAALLGGVSFLRFDAIPWLLAQVSFVQFYNPDFLRGYGVGALNGSLWTIPVELQFYVLVPLLYRLLRLRERPGNASLLSLAAASIAAQALLMALGEDSRVFLVKLYKMTLAPYLWMFLLGTLLQRNFARIGWMLRGKGLLWLGLYLAIAFVCEQAGLRVGSNHPNPVPMAVLGCATVSIAFTAPWLSERVLRGSDISYGAYIYHMVVVNGALAIGLDGSWRSFAVSSSIIVALSAISWFFVERPALRRKRNPLHAVSASTPG